MYPNIIFWFIAPPTDLFLGFVVWPLGKNFSEVVSLDSLSLNLSLNETMQICQQRVSLEKLRKSLESGN